MDLLQRLNLDAVANKLANADIVNKSVTYVQEFIEDPLSKWELLSGKEKLYVISAGSLVALSSTVYFKFKYDYFNLLKQGYRPADAASNVWQSMSRKGVNPSINGWQTCKDTFTFDDLTEFFTNMAVEHINFRSVLRYRLGAWYWIEISLLPSIESENGANLSKYNSSQWEDSDNNRFNSEFTRNEFIELYGFDLMRHLKYVEIDKLPESFEKKKTEYVTKAAKRLKKTQNSNEFSDSNNSENNSSFVYNSDEILFDFITDYVNSGKGGVKLNPEWSNEEYDYIPHWHVYYFHFKSEKKCLVFFQCNHSVIDGLLTGVLMQRMYEKMYSNIENKDKIPRRRRLSRLEYSLQQRLVKKQVVKRQMRSMSWSRFFYYVASIPVSIIELLRVMAFDKPDPYNAIFSDMHNKFKMAIGIPIDLERFKQVCKHQTPSATVNDLFMAIVARSVASYLKLKKDPLFTSLVKERRFSSLHVVAAVNLRPVDEDGLNKSVEKFSLTGENSNRMGAAPAMLPLTNVTTQSMAEVIKPVKYGYTLQLYTKVVNSVGLIPYAMEGFAENVFKPTPIGLSNVLGPTELMPIPGKREKVLDTETVMRKEYVNWVFGSGVTGILAVLFTFVTYNDAVRVGIVADGNCLNEPKELLECFMQEWEKYENEWKRDQNEVNMVNDGAEDVATV